MHILEEGNQDILQHICLCLDLSSFADTISVRAGGMRRKPWNFPNIWSEAIQLAGGATADMIVLEFSFFRLTYKHPQHICILENQQMWGEGHAILHWPCPTTLRTPFESARLSNHLCASRIRWVGFSRERCAKIFRCQIFTRAKMSDTTSDRPSRKMENLATFDFHHWPMCGHGAAFGGPNPWQVRSGPVSRARC